jgi:hypothetical protein
MFHFICGEVLYLGAIRVHLPHLTCVEVLDLVAILIEFVHKLVVLLQQMVLLPYDLEGGGQPLLRR